MKDTVIVPEPVRHLVDARCDVLPGRAVHPDVEADESRVVARAAGGDERALRTLIELHYDACLRYATRLLGNRSDAEDVVQDVFVRMYRGLPAYREQGHFRAWLFRILVNQCRTIATSSGARRATQLDDVPEQELVSEDRDVATMRSIERAVAALPELLREAFILKFVEGWSYEEMAEMTGASTSALKMRVARGRDMLREQLREVYDVRAS